MKHTLLLLCVCLSVMAYGQKHDYIWFTGPGLANPFDTTFNSTIIDFNKQPFKPEYTEIDMRFIGSTCSVMSDTAGKLLFYTNGCYIANADGDTIEGGGNLNFSSGPAFDYRCEDKDGYPIRWSTCAVPLAPEKGKYAIIHKDQQSNWANSNNPIFAYNMYITRIDMSANGGKGKVTDSRIVFTDTLSFSDVTACKHANGKDWWFMVGVHQTNKYHKFLLQEDTLLGPFIQEIGDFFADNNDAIQAVFSPDGRHYARANWCNNVAILDFDRSTGDLSNFRKYSDPCDDGLDSVKISGVAFSPNSKYLYVSAWLKMFQFDTEASDFAASMKIAGIYNGHKDTVGIGPSSIFQQFFLMTQGPDCKIYCASPNQGRGFHVIHQPDLPVPDCNFQQNAFKLPTWHTGSMPNFPHYRLGSTTMPNCDSTLSVVSAVWHTPPLQSGVPARIYPNPTDGPVQLDIDLGHYPTATLYIMDITGRVCFAAPLQNFQWSYEYQLRQLGPGYYFYQVTLPSGKVVAKDKLVIIRQ